MKIFRIFSAHYTWRCCKCNANNIADSSKCINCYHPKCTANCIKLEGW